MPIATMKIQVLLVGAVAVMHMFASPAQADLIAKLQANEKYTTLMSFLSEANLTDALASAVQRYGSVTIFAPDNAAFEKAFSNKFSLQCFDFNGPNGTDILKAILLHHVVIGKYSTFNDGQKLDTLLEKSKLNISIVDKRITPQQYVQVNSVAAIEDNQGVVHGINGILIPPQIKIPKCTAAAPAPAPAPATATATTPSGVTGNTTEIFAPSSGPSPAPDSASTLMIGSGVLGLLVASLMLLF
eukprot:TRINITY_DN17233_c0_g1_i2.p1 TRINITY_DN17233_c0_g1~~TRINITY_DN17233_c0_g1_i2.p1  ORF type:complete len:243 (-),score=45.45 TRINITY_DN17233_c0_g1_i2:493-1221(-)